MSKTKEEQLIFDYVLTNQMLKRGISHNKEELRKRLDELSKQINLKDENVTRKCISVSKGIVHRRNSMYKTMFEKALDESDAMFIEDYVYQCIGMDVDPEVKGIIEIKLVI